MGILKLKSQSAKISDNFHFRGGGGGILKLKSQSAKISDNFHFWGRGGILKLKSQSANISDNFHFWGEGGILKLYFRIGVFCRIWTKISTTPAGSCITDSLSHTTYVETNQAITELKPKPSESRKIAKYIYYYRQTEQICLQKSFKGVISQKNVVQYFSWEKNEPIMGKAAVVNAMSPSGCCAFTSLSVNWCYFL